MIQRPESAGVHQFGRRRQHRGSGRRRDHCPVRLDPGTVVESADPSTIVLTDPAATFASTQIAQVIPAPTVTALSPTHGAAAGGTR